MLGIMVCELETDRLVLRSLRPDDAGPLAAMNADPRVMKHFVAALTREQSDRLLERAMVHVKDHGFGLCAVEAREDRRFLGFVGLVRPVFEAHFTPCVEIGWRLVHTEWGKGYATEAGRAMVREAFDRFEMPELVSFTVPANRRSRAVMERLGMQRDPQGDFEHPGVPVGHPLRKHVLYRLRNPRRE